MGSSAKAMECVLFGGAGDGLTVVIGSWSMKVRVNLVTKIDPKLRWDQDRAFRFWDVADHAVGEQAESVAHYVWSERRRRYEAAELKVP